MVGANRVDVTRSKMATSTLRDDEDDSVIIVKASATAVRLVMTIRRYHCYSSFLALASHHPPTIVLGTLARALVMPVTNMEVMTMMTHFLKMMA